MTGCEALKALEDNKIVRRKIWPEHWYLYRRLDVHFSNEWLEEIASKPSYSSYLLKEMGENIVNAFLFNDDWEIVE